MFYEFWISYRYLVSKRREKFISIIGFMSVAGVALGVASLIVVIAVMSGFDHDLREKIVGTNSHLVIEKNGGIENYNIIINKLLNMPHVKAGSPFINGQALVRQDDYVRGVIFRGIDIEREKDVTDVKKFIIEGTYNINDNEILIGKELAWRMGVGLEDDLTFISATDQKGKKFKIKGIFASGMFDYDMNLVFTTIPTAQKFYQVEGLVGGIGVKIDNLYKAESVKNYIQGEIGLEYGVKTWSELNKNLFSALKLEKITMFIILTLIVVVACFNIVSTLIMMVMEKIRDIGILKAIGITNDKIRNIFILNGFSIGAVGTLLGTLSGWFLCYLLKTYDFIKLPSDIYYIDKLPIQLNFSDILIVVASTMVITLISTVYPAIQASRLQPVDALRYE